ncbi:alpha/beta hydrolase fold-1 [Tanacetum coccineum]
MDKRDGKFGSQPMTVPPAQQMSRFDQPYPPNVGYGQPAAYGAYPPGPPPQQVQGYPPSAYPQLGFSSRVTRGEMVFDAYSLHFLCINFTASRDWCLSRSFGSAGLKSTTTTLHDGDTSIHCWIPKTYKPSKPNLILVHGIGANAKWQWDLIISRVTPLFNVYVPDLLFYGDSYTTRMDRTEQFQAECVMTALERVGLTGKFNLVGLSYGGFVGYNMALQFPEVVDRVMIIGSGVSLDSDIDVEEGLFSAKNIKDAANILLAQTPEKTRELLKISFYKPLNPNLAPSCLIKDYIDMKYCSPKL